MTSIRKKQPVPMVHRIPLTRIKFFIARLLYYLLRIVVKNDVHTIKRNGLLFQLDLSQAIDLSLFLFGAYQKHVIRQKYYDLPEDGIVFDVGANIGAMTLGLSVAVPNGHVYAFEPDPLTCEKLQQNIALNPEMAGRITTVPLFISDVTLPEPVPHRIYASWKLNRQSGERHPLHAGIHQEITTVHQMTLDDFCRKNEISRVDLVKIDTDGYEYQVLTGCRQMLATSRPVIVFEAGLYTIAQGGITFDDIYNYLSGFGYRLINSKTGKIITLQNYCRHIPLRYTIDIVAISE